MQAIVRFEVFNGEQAALTAKSVDGKLTVNGQEVVTRILEGQYIALLVNVIFIGTFRHKVCISIN